MQNHDTICAIATAHGVGAIAVIRLSGEDAISICEKIFKPAKSRKKLSEQKTATLHYGSLKDGKQLIDDVVVSIFLAPHSYTGENTIEISCHGSFHIQQIILQLLVQQGARLAKAGEFTLRAFLNGKLDLSQAEAVADLIATQSEAAHRIAMQQMRGGFSSELSELRHRLLNFISLIELELDFSEEDVEFADRSQLRNLIAEIEQHISKLRNSFQLGNAIKNGIPVAIIGEPNVGKSTLLNVLLNEDKAIVSEIAGTTRDAIEDVISIKGILFRFIDTAGIRHTTDTIENLGIERTYQKIEKAEIVLLLVDTNEFKIQDSEFRIQSFVEKYPDKKWILVLNKMDKMNKESNPDNYKFLSDLKTVQISAKHKQNIDKLENALLEAVHYEQVENNGTIISNTRHYEALTHAYNAAQRVTDGLNQHISGDFLAQDIREILHYLGEITGEITNDEILENIFKNFCIGK